MTDLQDKPIAELEVRIMLAKKALEWLHSDDPMLNDPKYKDMVPMAKELYMGQLVRLEDALREKKKPPEVVVELKRAVLTARGKT